MLFANIVINYEFENRTYKPNTICRNINKLFAESRGKSREKPTESGEKKIKSREKIIVLLSQYNSLSAAALAERIGITPKAVEKHIARMKAEGILKRVGPDKGRHWQVAEKTSE